MNFKGVITTFMFAMKLLTFIKRNFDFLNCKNPRRDKCCTREAFRDVSERRNNETFKKLGSEEFITPTTFSFTRNASSLGDLSRVAYFASLSHSSSHFSASQSFSESQSPSFQFQLISSRLASRQQRA